MTKNLYFMRHGVTELNTRNCWQGRADSPLTELGRRQAREAGEHIREAGIEFDRIYRSPAGRVAQTLACALPERAADAVVEPDLAEIDFGSLDGTVHVAGQPESPFTDQFVPFGGEDEEDVYNRALAAILRAMDEPGANNVLVVSHGTVGRIFRNKWARLAQVEAPRHLSNCSLYRYEFDPEARTFSLAEIYEPASATSPDDFLQAW